MGQGFHEVNVKIVDLKCDLLERVQDFSVSFAELDL